MKVTIYNAISLDGFIADPEHDTSWVSEADWRSLEKMLTTAEIVIMGSKTYEISLGGDGCIPYGSVHNYVFTKEPEKYEIQENVTFTSNDPVSLIREHESENILVIGGGQLNGTLLKSKTVTDIICSIHPVILGAGIRQFEAIDSKAQTALTKISEKDIGDGVTQIHYTVN